MDSGTDDMSASDSVGESPSDDTAFELEPSAEHSRGSEDVPTDEVEEEVAPAEEPIDEDSGNEDGEEEFAPE